MVRQFLLRSERGKSYESGGLDRATWELNNFKGQLQANYKKTGADYGLDHQDLVHEGGVRSLHRPLKPERFGFLDFNFPSASGRRPELCSWYKISRPVIAGEIDRRFIP